MHSENFSSGKLLFNNCFFFNLTICFRVSFILLGLSESVFHFNLKSELSKFSVKSYFSLLFAHSFSP